MQLLSCHKAVFVEAFCCALLMTLLGISTSYFVQHLVDSVLVRSEARLLNALGVGMLLIAFGASESPSADTAVKTGGGGGCFLDAMQ